MKLGEAAQAVISCVVLLLQAEGLPPTASAVVCVKEDEAGHISAAKVVESSGDPARDQTLLAQAAGMIPLPGEHFTPGWHATRQAIVADGKPDKPLPRCDP